MDGGAASRVLSQSAKSTDVGELAGLIQQNIDGRDQPANLVCALNLLRVYQECVVGRSVYLVLERAKDLPAPLQDAVVRRVEFVEFVFQKRAMEARAKAKRKLDQKNRRRAAAMNPNAYRRAFRWWFHNPLYGRGQDFHLPRAVRELALDCRWAQREELTIYELGQLYSSLFRAVAAAAAASGGSGKPPSIGPYQDFRLNLGLLEHLSMKDVCPPTSFDNELHMFRCDVIQNTMDLLRVKMEQEKRDNRCLHNSFWCVTSSIQAISPSFVSAAADAAALAEIEKSVTVEETSESKEAEASSSSSSSSSQV